MIDFLNLAFDCQKHQTPVPSQFYWILFGFRVTILKKHRGRIYKYVRWCIAIYVGKIVHLWDKYTISEEIEGFKVVKINNLMYQQRVFFSINFEFTDINLLSSVCYTTRRAEYDTNIKHMDYILIFLKPFLFILFKRFFAQTPIYTFFDTIKFPKPYVRIIGIVCAGQFIYISANFKQFSISNFILKHQFNQFWARLRLWNRILCKTTQYK